MSVGVMGLGLLVFTLGLFTWLYGRLRGRRLIDFWAYEYSRHPQYLGYILWSYGLLTYTTLLEAPKGGYYPVPTLPWLASAMIVVGVALLEEAEMVRRLSDKYLEYRRRAPS